MIDRLLVKLNNRIVSIDQVEEIDLFHFASDLVIVKLKDGTSEVISGFFAVELVWLLCPSALEGNNKIKWRKHTWAIHNIVAHPLMQLLAWMGYPRWGIWVHDITIPKPIDIK